MIGRMRYRHVALYADDLRRAEDFYAHVFAAEVLFREAMSSDGVWQTLPLHATWDDAERAGIDLQLVVLRRDDIFLPVFLGESVPRIVGLEATVKEADEMRRRLPEEAQVLDESERQLVFADPFAVEWQVGIGTGFRSSGEMHGRWLAV